MDKSHFEVEGIFLKNIFLYRSENLVVEFN